MLLPSSQIGPFGGPRPSECLSRHGGAKQPFLRTLQNREHGGYFRNKSGTLLLAFDHGSRQPCDARRSLIGTVVAFEFTSLELVGRIADHPSDWACAGIKPHSDTGWGRFHPESDPPSLPEEPLMNVP